MSGCIDWGGPSNNARAVLQVQIYTWPDATLRELTDLVKEVQPAARRTTARLEFALIYPDKKGRNVMRVIGGAHSTRPGPDDIKTLKQLNFQVRCCVWCCYAPLLVVTVHSWAGTFSAGSEDNS